MIQHDTLHAGFADEALPLLALLGAVAAYRHLQQALVPSGRVEGPSVPAPVDHPAHLVALGLLSLGGRLQALLPPPSPPAPSEALPPNMEWLR